MRGVNKHPFRIIEKAVFDHRCINATLDAARAAILVDDMDGLLWCLKKLKKREQGSEKKKQDQRVPQIQIIRIKDRRRG